MDDEQPKLGKPIPVGLCHPRLAVSANGIQAVDLAVLDECFEFFERQHRTREMLENLGHAHPVGALLGPDRKFRWLRGLSIDFLGIAVVFADNCAPAPSPAAHRPRTTSDIRPAETLPRMSSRARARPPRRRVRSGRLAESTLNCRQNGMPIVHRAPIGRAANRQHQAIGTVDVLEAETSLIAHEVPLRFGVIPRLQTVNDLVVLIGENAAAGAAIRADARNGLQPPDPLLIKEVLAARCADRADVDDVPRELVVARLAWENVDLRVTAAVNDLQFARSR